VRIKGFTLLELLLVIVILGIIASMGIGFYQRSAIDVKVQKTALQMQQIMQAASAYYTDNNCWPNSTTCKNPPSFNNYLPDGMNNNPWGQAYNFAEESMGKKFQVYSGDLPSAQTVNQLKAILPNAGVNPNNNLQVLAEIAAPVAGIEPSWIIANIGKWSNLGDASTGSFTFSCPEAWTYVTTAFPTSITLPKVGSWPYCTVANMAADRGINLLSFPTSCTQSTANNYSCNFSVNFNSYEPSTDITCLGSNLPNEPILVSDNNKVDVTIIAWCHNPKVKQSTPPGFAF
jgi:general secretion pathway protein G